MTKIEYEQQFNENEKLNQILIGKNQDLKLKEEEIAKLRIECGRIQKSKETVEKKINQMDAIRANLEEEKNKLTMRVITLEKELADAKKQSQSDQKTLEVLNREKEIITKAAQKTAGKNFIFYDFYKIMIFFFFSIFSRTTKTHFVARASQKKTSGRASRYNRTAEKT